MNPALRWLIAYALGYLAGRGACRALVALDRRSAATGGHIPAATVSPDSRPFLVLGPSPLVPLEPQDHRSHHHDAARLRQYGADRPEAN